MAVYTFPTDKYPDVRAAIGLDVSSVELSDDTLDLIPYKGEAERFIMRNLSETQYSDTGQIDTVNAAAIFYLAALAIPRLRIVNSERIAGGNLTYSSVNLTALAQDLENKAGILLTEVRKALPDTDLPVTTPIYFGVAHRQPLGY